jgi:hypothetical protein
MPPSKCLLVGLYLWSTSFQLPLSPAAVDVKAWSSTRDNRSSHESRRKFLAPGGMIEANLRLETLPHRMTAFLLMAEQAVIAETHAAKTTTELLTMKNLMPAFTAFDGSIDQLKHRC